MKRKGEAERESVDERGLDLGYLALFVGYAFNHEVQTRLEEHGFKGLRQSHGFVFQHLVDGPRTIGELAERLEVTQQAASKAVAELEGLGYVERSADEADARVRRVRLSARGQEAVAFSRRARAALERRIEERHGARALAETRARLADVLETLGGVPAVRARRVRMPR